MQKTGKQASVLLGDSSWAPYCSENHLRIRVGRTRGDAEPASAGGGRNVWVGSKTEEPASRLGCQQVGLDSIGAHISYVSSVDEGGNGGRDAGGGADGDGEGSDGDDGAGSNSDDDDEEMVVVMETVRW